MRPNRGPGVGTVRFKGFLTNSDFCALKNKEKRPSRAEIPYTLKENKHECKYQVFNGAPTPCADKD